MVQLAGKRYDEETDTITIVGKKCPTRKQNKEYVLYLLKVLYLESNVRYTFKILFSRKLKLDTS